MLLVGLLHFPLTLYPCFLAFYTNTPPPFSYIENVCSYMLHSKIARKEYLLNNGGGEGGGDKH